MHELLKCAYTMKILNMPQVLNNRVLNMQELHNIWHNIAEYVFRGCEYAWICLKSW